MQKYLEKLYSDSIALNEGTFPRDPTYQQKLKKAAELEKMLLAGLPEEKEEIYEKIQYAVADCRVIEEAQAFIDAFKLGARLMLELLIDDGTA